MSLQSSIAPVTQFDADRALRKYASMGHVVDACNPDHIQAYMTLRTWHKRISADVFVKYLADRKTDVATGASSRLQYWGVPKRNFPNGLPEAMRDAEVSGGDLEALAAANGGEIDTQAYYVVDQQVERRMLGKDVRVFETCVNITTKVRIIGGSGSSRKMLPPQAATGAPETSPTLHEPKPSTADAVMVPATGAPNVIRTDAPCLKRRRSDESADDDDGLPPAAKRAKQQLDTLRVLRDGVVGAASQQSWHSDNALNHATVDTLLAELLACLADLTQNSSASTSSNSPLLIVNKFQGFVTDKILLANNCYVHLQHMQPNLQALLDLGGDDPVQREVTQLLMVLATVSSEKAGDSMPDMTAAGVVVYRGAQSVIFHTTQHLH